MTANKFTLCRRCASCPSTQRAFGQRKSTGRRPLERRSFLTTTPRRQRPLLKIPPPDPTAAPPKPPPSIRRDPGLTLGQNGIPVTPSPEEAQRRRRQQSQEEKSWAETVFRTLSGGMKSDYLKCMSPQGGSVG